MKVKITALLIVILLIASGCQSEAIGEDQTGDITEQVQGVWPLDEDITIATLGDESVPALLYAYFFTIYESNLIHSAAQSGFGGDNIGEFWQMDMGGGGVTISDMLHEETMRTAKEYTALYRLAIAAGLSEGESEASGADSQIASLLEQLDGDEHAFAQTYRLTPEQMRTAMRQVNLAAAYLFQVMEEIDVDELVRGVYDENPEAFAQVVVRHVLISPGEERDDQEAGELAQEILDRINAGEDIGELAAIYSDDPGSRYAQGEYTFGMGVMVEPFETWAFAAAIGDTGIVQTNFGYHVMQLMGIPTFEELDFSAIEHEFRTTVFNEQHQELYDMVNSDGWVYNEELIERFFASLA